MAAAKQQFSLGKSQVSKDMMTAFMEGAIEEEITTVPGIGTCGMAERACHLRAQSRKCRRAPIVHPCRSHSRVMRTSVAVFQHCGTRQNGCVVASSIGQCPHMVCRDPQLTRLPALSLHPALPRPRCIAAEGGAKALAKHGVYTTYQLIGHYLALRQPGMSTKGEFLLQHMPQKGGYGHAGNITRHRVHRFILLPTPSPTDWCNAFWVWLGEHGIGSYRSGIVHAIAEKVDLMIPGTFVKAELMED
jgi:hypothetical protein